MHRSMTTWAALVTALAAGAARADDWPQWLGPQRDGVWRETGIIEAFPEGGPKVLWRTPIGGGYSGPAVAGGKVFVMDRQLAPGAKNPKEGMIASVPGSERVICLDAADGRVLWKHEYNCTYTVQYGVGPRATPTVHEGKVYTLGTQGNLFCLDADSGKVIWFKDLPKDYDLKVQLWGFASHLLVDGKKLICLVGGKDKSHTVVAFDKDTGAEIWRTPGAAQAGYCPPMIYELGGQRTLVIWDPATVSGLDPETGKVRWSKKLNPNFGMAIATPRVFGDSLFVTGYTWVCAMLRPIPDKPEPEVVWEASAKTQKTRGMFSVFGTPFVEDGYIYGDSTDGKLVCIKADTGERVWDSLAPNNGKKAPSGDAFLVKNGDRFFVANEKGDLIIAKLSPKSYEEVSRAHLLEPTSQGFGREVVWSHPAFANRCAYMRNDKEIICVSLAK